MQRSNPSTPEDRVRRKKSSVVVGYRIVTGQREFERRLQRLHEGVRQRCASRIQRWWRTAVNRSRRRRHVETLRNLILLNARATVIQRWWRTLLSRDPSSNKAEEVGLQMRAETMEAILNESKTLIVKSERVAISQARHQHLRSVWVKATEQVVKPKNSKTEATAGRSHVSSSQLARRWSGRPTYWERQTPQKFVSGRYENDDMAAFSRQMLTLPARQSSQPKPLALRPLDTRGTMRSQASVISPGAWNSSTKAKSPWWLAKPKLLQEFERGASRHGERPWRDRNQRL